MTDATPGTVPVVDHRTPPAGVLPRHAQAWLMGGLALGILLIILISGRPQPVSRDASATPTPTILSPDRLREYQDRLRGLETRASQKPTPELPPTAKPVGGASEPTPAVAPRPVPPVDPTDADRKRRDYDSLFASNVVLSRRGDGQRLTTGESRTTRVTPPVGDGAPTMPNIDEVADAVVRASARHAPPALPGLPSPSSSAAAPTVAPAPLVATSAVAHAPTPPIRTTDSLHRLLEGTVIDTVLTNRLDGAAAAPVNCLVTNAVYAYGGEAVLIPAGARVLGQTKPVQAFGETRLAVAFTRLVMPDGRTYPLDHFLGLNAIGDAGLRDQVDQHYRTTFGASAAVGLLSGFAQFLTGTSVSRSTGTSPVVVAGSVSDATTQATAQTMNRFLNRLPTVTIREGHRVKVYLTSDLELPAYALVDRGGAGRVASRE
jgi:type IV secretory pathway VirB10-like protein